MDKDLQCGIDVKLLIQLRGHMQYMGVQQRLQQLKTATIEGEDPEPIAQWEVY